MVLSWGSVAKLRMDSNSRRYGCKDFPQNSVATIPPSRTRPSDLTDEHTTLSPRIIPIGSGRRTERPRFFGDARGPVGARRLTVVSTQPHHYCRSCPEWHPKFRGWGMGAASPGVPQLLTALPALGPVMGAEFRAVNTPGCYRFHRTPPDGVPDAWGHRAPHDVPRQSSCRCNLGTTTHRPLSTHRLGRWGWLLTS